MSKQKLLVVLGGMMLFCAGLIIFSIHQMTNLEKEIERQKEAKRFITAYLERAPSDPYTNTVALESFDAPKPKQDEDEAVKHQFISPEGFPVMSDTDTWDEAKLKALYNELKQNAHGEEMYDLHSIFVHGDANEGAAGAHNYEVREVPIQFGFPAFLEVTMHFQNHYGFIHLYNGDEAKTIESMALTLSHEYGHHYTFRYMFDYRFDELQKSEYVALRGLTDHEDIIFRYDEIDDYWATHRWHIWEVAAYDYTQLMGSETAKKMVTYYDDRDQLVDHITVEWILSSINGMPQNNFQLPFANEVDGLHDYFYSFLEEEDRKSAPNHKRPDIRLEITKKSKTHDLVDGARTFPYYEFTWNKPAGNDVVYTLVYYNPDENDQVVPVKSIHGNERAVAYMGSYSYERNNQVRWWENPETTGTKVFFVTTLFPDGSVYKSDPVTYTFH